MKQTIFTIRFREFSSFSTPILSLVLALHQVDSSFNFYEFIKNIIYNLRVFYPIKKRSFHVTLNY